MQYNKLEDYIYIVKNALSLNLCDEILNEYKNKDEWVDATVGRNATISKSIRNCKGIGISFLSVIKKNYEARSRLDNVIYNEANKCIKKYSNRFPHCKIEKDSGYELLEYSEGCFYTQHTDSFVAMPRAVSCSFMLNHDFEGGEFAFFDRELIYKLEKGDAIMFPSNFMYPHEIMPVTKGTRCSMITWFV